MVWYRGTFWRCEIPHTSGTDPLGAPTSNFDLWTPVSSSGPYPQQYPTVYPPPYGRSNPLDILSPVPLPMPVRPPSVATSSNSDSSPDTVTGEERGNRTAEGKGGRMASLDYFQAKAAESMRFIVRREETTKERDENELRAELRGKRVWRVGGIGLWAYSQDPDLEEMKKSVWRAGNGEEDWLSAARSRTKFYTETRGVKPMVLWKLVEKGNIPKDALPLGNEADGAVLYAARGWFDGGLHIGKAGHHLVNHASISFGAGEHALNVYEVLCGSTDPDLVKWMTFRHGENAMVEGWQPVEGGREANGSVLLVGKGEYENGHHPGKCLINDDHACVGYGGGELWVRPFQILAYSTASKR